MKINKEVIIFSPPEMNMMGCVNVQSPPPGPS